MFPFDDVIMPYAYAGGRLNPLFLLPYFQTLPADPRTDIGQMTVSVQL